MTSDRSVHRFPEVVGRRGASEPALHPAVFEAKLRPAVNPSYVLPRPRLTALLEELVAAPLTMVLAPAGSGKTSLLRSWAAETSRPYAWVSLDEHDRDPVRLWQALLTALERVAPGCSAAAGEVLRRPGGLVEGVAILIADLETRDLTTTVLIVDDLQFVDAEESATESLALFVQHLPRWLRVVLASRRAPHLPVHRLRARGQLAEMHFPEMRFTMDEAAAMLGRLAPSLDRELTLEVAGRAGGWAASIQLAALAARSAHAQGKRYLPSGDDDRLLLEDYVMQEVLAHESDELVDVLVATSIVKHIDAALATVLAARPDAADQLTLAEERGLFITRVDPSGFEMHALIREVLQSVLARRAPERLASLHARAAAWNQERGNTTVALEHWLRALRPREALALLAAEMPTLYDSGHESTILRTARGIPEHVALQDPRMLADLAWCHALVDRQRYLGLVDQLSRLVRNDLDLDPAFDARLEVLQSIAVTLRGHWVDGASLARSALQGLGQTWWLDPLGQFCWNMVARDIALSERWDDSGEEARQVLRALSVVPDRRVAFEGTRALAEALAGRPVDALRLVAGARRASPVANMTILQTELLTAEAIASRELGDLGVARALLEEVSQGRIEPAPHCQLLARLELTQARLDEGDPVAAGRAFGLAAELVDTEMPGPGSRSWLARTGTVLALADGDVDGARDWAAQVTDTFWSGVSSARVLLATGERTLAVDALKGAEPRCLRHQVISDLLMFRATEVPAEAEGHLVEAVRLAARLGLVHTVASEGRDVVEGIERLAWQAPRDWMGRLRRVGGPGTEAPTRGSDVPVDALTDRELEVLRLLPSRLTLREIADELFISINTLKFHLKVIYRKLGCTCRAEAAERARAMASLRRSRQPSSTLPR